MIEFFTNKKNVMITPDLKGNDQKLTVIIGLKQSLESGTIEFYSYNFGFNEFINILGEEKPPTELGDHEKIKLKYKLDLLTIIIYVFICILIILI